jgi:signal transduction histidine kinase
LLGLINTVLDIAKIESGQFTLNMTEYAIESVVETVRAATESLAQNKKLTLTTSVEKSLPVGLGDEQRLTQVLLNLVGNAIKFTDAGEVSIAAGARNGHFAVSVTDTGPGIPLARISHTKKCIGAPNQRKFFCNKDFPEIRGRPDDDRL